MAIIGNAEIDGSPDPVVEVLSHTRRLLRSPHQVQQSHGASEVLSSRVLDR